MTEYLLQIGGLWLLMLYIYSHYPEIIDIMKVLRKGGGEEDRFSEPLNIL